MTLAAAMTIINAPVVTPPVEPETAGDDPEAPLEPFVCRNFPPFFVKDVGKFYKFLLIF